MKKYKKPEMEVLILEEEQVITTSAILGDNNGNPGSGSSIEWDEWWKTGGN